MGSQEQAQTNDLKARRLAAGLTRQQLAQLADCSVSVIGLYENGWAPERSTVLERINKALAEQLAA